MSVDGKKLREEARACLGKDRPAGELVDCVARTFPDLEVYREMDDLIIKGGSRFLIVRRMGADRFRASENAWAPTTNLVDFGGGTERTLDQLIDEISVFGR
jgi:hypothetical protein